jgi:Tfp pilus assembly protein PilV
MTLMEAVVALVLLALAAVGCLELAHGASRLEFSATEWNAAVSVAESQLAQVSLGVRNPEQSQRVNARDADRVQRTTITREPWRAGLDLVTVSVPVTDGKLYVLRKLVRSEPARTAELP